MHDLIERQAAIDAHYEYCNKHPDAGFPVWSLKILEDLPSAQPTEESCWGCNCPKMERLKEQKTFSEMVHLHDAETHEERTETHACDLISRQAAIDAILAVTGNSSVRELYEHVQEHGLSDMWSGGVNAAIDIIIAVPPVQPEKRTEERTETHACDCISRQDAIEAIAQCTCCGNEDTLRAYVLKHTLDNGWCGGILEALDAVKDLPSAQPEIMKWIPCSERLPEGKQEVLVTEYGDTDMGRRFDGRWVDRYGDKMKDVTAWMPLPEPYREEGE